MIYDAEKDTRSEEVLQADICIVGSGAAGISIAHKFIGSSKKVILLESSRVNERKFGSDTAGFLRTEFPPDQHHRYEDPTVQPLCKGSFPDGDADDFLYKSRIRCYGGTTNCWGGWTRPLVAEDFDRSDLNTPHDPNRPPCKWPIQWNDLRPFYNEAISKYCSLGDWDASEYDDPNCWVSKTEEKIAPIDLKLGSALRSVVFTIVYDGGPRRDKGLSLQDGCLDFQLVWGPDIERASNIYLYRNANVREIGWNRNPGTVISVKATIVQEKTKKPGHTFYVAAKKYVLATGAIETARLLLVSNLNRGYFPIGSCLMVHPLIDPAATFDITNQVPEEVRRFYSGTPSVARPVNPPKFFATLVPGGKTLRDMHIGNFRAVIGFGDGQSTTGTVNLNWEQLPDIRNCIKLDDEDKKDSLFGDRRVKVALQLGEPDMDTLKEGLRLVGSQLEKLGYAKNFKPTENPLIYLPGAHALGTARMANLREQGIVDLNCRVHDIDNLYVSGGAVFPTSGCANPTLTIVALALRLAKHLGV